MSEIDKSEQSSIKVSGSAVHGMHWEEEGLALLDQRLLPHRVEYVLCTSAASVVGAIKSMVVRGAPAIGIAAAYGVVLSVRESLRLQADQGMDIDWQEKVREDLVVLGSSRPTAVNLSWALAKMETLIEAEISTATPLATLFSMVEQMAIEMHESDMRANFTMGQLGANLIAESIRPSMPAVLTHCNTGSLATGGYGTALGVIRASFMNGVIEHVYVDESRPWLQGSRLTAWELQSEGIPCSVIVDSAVAYMMSQGDIGWVIVGADRIAANGDVANKIGTYSLAIAAQFHQVKVMVVAPTSSFDLSLSTGEDIPIEERDAREILQWKGEPVAAADAAAVNPVFDITPADLIDVIVTERGVIENPTPEAVRELLTSTERLH